MTTPAPRLLVLGAHPDDAEYRAAGLASLWSRAGGDVRFVSATNGDAGHPTEFGAALAARRATEAAASASVIGAEHAIWDHADGFLVPDLALREQVLAELRRWRPDLVLTHRLDDYHPDHRALAHAVRDAAYLVTVPALLPELPVQRRPPVVAYLADEFERPAPLRADLLVDVSEVFDDIVAMLDAHASQFYQWLPFNQCIEDQVPRDADARRDWLRAQTLERYAALADRHREDIVANFGVDGIEMQRVEVFEISEYGAPLTTEACARLLPFAG